MPNMDQMCVRSVHAYAYAATQPPHRAHPTGTTRPDPARLNQPWSHSGLPATQGFAPWEINANVCGAGENLDAMRAVRGDAMRAIPATVTAGAAARSRTAAVEPLLSAAKAVRVGPPARVRSGRLGCPRLPRGSSARDGGGGGSATRKPAEAP